ncbi:tRNA (guanosine(37)-N1)-methyltransferase TrmD [Candidatus Fermentibacteria bacterium]|nr:tRNA (guanosine(37)-N1)-methyltransferase TrmD [Candidatus Fermentibacteria bacterium]
MAELRFAVATLFPQLVKAFLVHGITGKAVDSGVVEVEIHDLRDRAVDARGSVDDYQFGGGAGMVLRPEPLFRTLDAVEWAGEARVVLMTASGPLLDQELARELANSEGVIIFCGRYGGVDERFRREAISDEVSVGSFVTSGGELPAMLLMESVMRWVPGVLGRLESARSDSFATGLLDYPRYTRPAEYGGMGVPDVLLSGDHEAIRQWRYERALERTRAIRPELLSGRDQSEIRNSFMQAMQLAERHGERDDG